MALVTLTTPTGKLYVCDTDADKPTASGEPASSRLFVKATDHWYCPYGGRWVECFSGFFRPTDFAPLGADGRVPSANLPAAQAGTSPLTLYRVAANIANNSNVNFSALATHALAANDIVSFEGCIYFASAATTTGLVMAVDAPLAPTYMIANLWTGESATASRNLTTTVSGASLIGTASAGATIIAAWVSGTIENGSNSGNAVIKFRSEVNASAVTVQRGSWIKFFKH
jgi:hypothetical protein